MPTDRLFPESDTLVSRQQLKNDLLLQGHWRKEGVADPVRKVNMVLNVHRNKYGSLRTGRGGYRGGGEGTEEVDYIYIATLSPPE